MEKLRITLNDRSYDVTVEVLEEVDENNQGGKTTPAVPAKTLTAINGGKSPSTQPKSSASKTFNAPMPGTVLDIKVSAGNSVKQGQVLIILEAMKMENELVAESDGVVKEIHVSKGQSVQAGELLISLA